MRRTLKQFIAEPRILKSVIIFLVLYIILSALWMRINDIYGYGITLVASKITEEVKDAEIEKMTEKSGLITVTFSSIKRGKQSLVEVPVNILPFAFNVPMIVAMLISFYPFLKRKKRACTEAFLLVLVIHILYSFSFEAQELTKNFMAKGMEEMSQLRLSGYVLLWRSIKYASMSFAPFLIMIYIFIRFRR